MPWYHLALTHIIKSTAESITTRIKRLLEVLGSNSFNLYYMKGKDNISERGQGKYLVQTRSQAKSSGITLARGNWCR